MICFFQTRWQRLRSARRSTSAPAIGSNLSEAGAIAVVRHL